jgi:hypothetical protein
MNLLGALLIILFGFLFVTVSSRLTGEIGSSSNPISGMTVATLLLTCLCFVLLRWTGSNYYVTALSIGAIVCIASSNGGTTSQDLKTGFLVGGTPSRQQIAILRRGHQRHRHRLRLAPAQRVEHDVPRGRLPTYVAPNITDQTHTGPTARTTGSRTLREDAVLVPRADHRRRRQRSPRSLPSP